MREMESLYNIFKCVGSDRCKYFENERYCTPSENAVDSEHLAFEECVPGGKVYVLIADELLLIENGRSPREKVLIGRFPKDGKCRISYMGDSARSMRKTTEALRLPSSWPTITPADRSSHRPKTYSSRDRPSQRESSWALTCWTT